MSVLEIPNIFDMQKIALNEESYNKIINTHRELDESDLSGGALAIFKIVGDKEFRYILRTIFNKVKGNSSEYISDAYTLTNITLPILREQCFCIR